MLGVYFGSKIINVTETKGGKIIRNICIPLATLSVGGLEERVPDEIKIVALFKDEFRKAGFEPREAVIALSGKDLIVRTFEIPPLRRSELRNALIFEVRKYIPFKLEDLIFDFQYRFDRLRRKNLVLFVGIKREVINKYFSIFSQLNIRIDSIEYCGFSVLRLLKLKKIREKGINCVINVDFDDEANFMVLEEGLPLFSRDITLVAEHGQATGGEAPSLEKALDKLKTETKISLEYYDRTFHVKGIEQLFFISPNNYQLQLESFFKEMGFTAQFIDFTQFLSTAGLFSLKSYSASLEKKVGTNLKINLMGAVKIKPQKVKETAIPESLASLTNLKIDIRAVIAGLVICLLSFGISFYHRQPLKQELSRVIAMRPKVSAVSANTDYAKLTQLDSDYKNKIKTIDGLLSKQIFFSELLNALPKLLPEGVWLNNFSIRKASVKRTEFNLSGIVSLGNSGAEFQAVNNLLSNLKKDKVFSKYFDKFTIISLDTVANPAGKGPLITFKITALAYENR